jgi:hypothetical protein
MNMRIKINLFNLPLCLVSSFLKEKSAIKLTLLKFISEK